MKLDTPIPPEEVRRKVMGEKLLEAYRKWEKRASDERRGGK